MSPPTTPSLPIGAIGAGAVKISPTQHSLSATSAPTPLSAIPSTPSVEQNQIEDLDTAETVLLHKLSLEKANPDAPSDSTRKIDEMPPRAIEGNTDLSLPRNDDDVNPISCSSGLVTPLSPLEEEDAGEEEEEIVPAGRLSMHKLQKLSEQLSSKNQNLDAISPTEVALSPPDGSRSPDMPQLAKSTSMSSIATGIQDYVNKSASSNILMEQQTRIQRLEEQVNLLMLQNRELVNHVSYLMAQDHQKQRGEFDIHKMAEILENQYEINRKVRTVALVNTTSGSGRQYGETLMKRFGSLLGAENVFEMSKGPKVILEVLMRESRTELRVIVAGGDGSANWVMNSLNQLEEEWLLEQKQKLRKSPDESHVSLHRDLPKIAIFPLGVGNDLARILKWGGSFNPLTDSITLYTKRVAEAQVVKLDRWNIEFKSESKTITYLCSNYFSLGVDAQIALNFHLLRKENPQLCLNRTTNKLWYLSYGIGELLKSPEHLGKSVKVTADHKRVAEKRAQSLIWVNIPSYSGGTNLWQPAQQEVDGLRPQAIDDGLIECVSVTSVNHMAQIKAGIQPAVAVAQGRKWKIVFSPTVRRPTLAAQVDGEPFMLEERTEITIRRQMQVDVLAGESPSLLDILSHVPKI
uniref:Diacylglycerol kinase n=1 Tax=Percolomonas cosmopolitus TaxID=63605 RepID=A0A7S1KSS8_9EUKA